MKSYSKTIVLSCAFIAMIALFCLILMRPEGYPAHSSKNRIVGTVLDLANRPVSGIPFMLYEGGNPDCIYARISNTSGMFQMPIPAPNVYYFVTIVDKERILLQSFNVMLQSNVVDMTFIYSGINLSQTAVRPSPPPTLPEKPEVPPKPVPTNPSNMGTLEGELLVENRHPTGDSFFDITGEHLEKKTTTTYRITAKDGIYRLAGISPGPYKFSAQMPEYNPVTGVEIFILGDQSNRLNLNFSKTGKGKGEEKTVQATSSGADISITVIDAGWTPQAGAQVTLEQKNGDYQKIESTDPNGEIIFHNVPTGEYQIRAVFNGVRGQCELEERVSSVPGKFVSLVLREAE